MIFEEISYFIKSLLTCIFHGYHSKSLYRYPLLQCTSLSSFAIALLPKSTVVQDYVADFSFWTLTFLCNSVSAVSLSALFFWNQLTVLSKGCLYWYTVHNSNLIRALLIFCKYILGCREFTPPSCELSTTLQKFFLEHF
jgi:hypothetical protein